MDADPLLPGLHGSGEVSDSVRLLGRELKGVADGLAVLAETEEGGEGRIVGGEGLAVETSYAHGATVTGSGSVIKARDQVGQVDEGEEWPAGRGYQRRGPRSQPST